MPIKRKDHLDKAAWAWAETVDHADITDGHIETAYRIKLKPCKAGSCRRNCRGNPHCLSGIGERSWLCDISDETWHRGEDPEAERRRGNAFVGLRNLGATCYVNSLLQLWFHNLAFRKAVYLWQPDAASDKAKESVGPTASVSHLQRLFALMQYGPRKYLDPTEFVLSLGLDTMTQQDAQEFSKLFLSMLEEQLASSSQLPEVRDMVRSQFLGDYDYVTRCLCCGTESACPSTFYELDLNISRSGSSTDEESSTEKPSVPRSSLAEFLQEFLQKEKLEGADRYHCAVCGSKQDATRSIELRRLPPVLTLQLLRFVFDRTTGHKKKLNSFVYFPEELDMSAYLNRPPKTHLYSLRAVLAHKGSSAYSGHYVAHICDTTSGVWYRFNDEAVEKLEGKKLQLGCDEDLLDSKKRKRPRTPKGQLSSNNAYMLVYVKVENGGGDMKGKTGLKREGESLELEQLPSHLVDIVKNETEEFEAWVAKQKECRDLSVQSGKERQAEIRSLYEIMPASHPDKDGLEDADWDFLSVNWLTKWLEDSSNGSEKGGSNDNIPPVNHTPLLCPHGRLRPNLVTQTKCVSILAADQIYERFGGGPRLRGKESMCRECVTVRCKSIRLRSKTAQDAQTITTLLKSQNDIEKGYWVGKASLRSWRRMALEEEDEIEGNEADSGGVGENEGGSMEGVECNLAEMSFNGSGEASQDQKPGPKEEEWNLGFNHDIVCSHGQLCSKDSNRRLVPESVWKILKSYFPTAPEFLSDSEKCSKCEDIAMEGQASKDHVRQKASKQREKLPDLYMEKGRPSFLSLNFSLAYIISRDFLNDWRRFIREPNKRPPPVSLCNQELICRHGGFLYDPCPQGPDDDARESSSEEANALGTPTVDVEADSRIALIWDHEWASLKEFYATDIEIVVRNEPIKCSSDKEMDSSEEAMDTDPIAPSSETVKEAENNVEKMPDHGIAEVTSSSQENCAVATTVEPASTNSSTPAENKVKQPTIPEQVKVVTIEPMPCRSCIRERLCRARESLLHYSRAKVFVRKVPSGTDAASCPVKDEEEEDDPEFKASAAKRARGKKANGTASPSVASQLAGEVRRSTRHRRIRGEEEVVVSSDSTLRDFKVKIMRLFGVAPFDQHLSLGGRDLIDPHATLSDLRVYPGSVITLKADEPWEDSTLLGDFDKGAAPEEGFKGTGLLSS